MIAKTCRYYEVRAILAGAYPAAGADLPQCLTEPTRYSHIELPDNLGTQYANLCEPHEDAIGGALIGSMPLRQTVGGREIATIPAADVTKGMRLRFGPDGGWLVERVGTEGGMVAIWAGGLSTLHDPGQGISVVVDPPPVPALDPDRQALVDGLRLLADWYAANPGVPAPRYPQFDLHLKTAGDGCDDTTGPAEVARLAAILGVDLEVSPGGHAIAEGRFGPVVLRAVYVPSESMREHYAQRDALKALAAAGWKPGDPVPVPVPVADPTGLGHSRPVDDEVGAVPVPDGVVDPLHEPDTEHRYEVGDLVTVDDCAGTYRVAAVSSGAEQSVSFVAVPGKGCDADEGEALARHLELATGRPVSGPPAAPERPSYDPNPTVDGRDPWAYARHAESLDGWAPGWHRDDLARMTPGLRVQAELRRDDERMTGGADRG